MYTITNNGKITVALPGRKLETVVLNPGKSREVSDEHMADLLGYEPTVHAIELGNISTESKDGEPKKTVKVVRYSGGWWNVHVNGSPTLKTLVRKKEAQRIADDLPR